MNGAARTRVLLALGVALCTLSFVVLSSTHIHSEDQNDSACRLCQAAHVSIAPAPALAVLPAPLGVRAEIGAQASAVALGLFLHSARSRAPPAA